MQTGRTNLYNSFRLVLLEDAMHQTGARCLDGSPAGYYYSPGRGPGKKQWLIFLQGGAWCDSVADCSKRAKSKAGSTKYWTANSMDEGFWKYGDAIWNDQEFRMFHRVVVIYCDGASFSGNVEAPINTGTQLLYSRGARILTAVSKSLLHERGMASAESVLLTGCSAGGLASILHAEKLQRLLPSSVSKFRVATFSGMFAEHSNVNGDPIFLDNMMRVFKLHNMSASLPKACIDDQPDGLGWRCLFAIPALKHVTVPVFLVQSMYDSWQTSCVLTASNSSCAGVDGWRLCGSDLEMCSRQQMAVINRFRDEQINTLVDSGFFSRAGNGAFLHSCHSHCAGVGMAAATWSTLSQDGVVMQQAVHRWWATPVVEPSNKHTYWPCRKYSRKPYSCNPSCMERAANSRIGVTHSQGCYHLTNKPFLLEGAETLSKKLGTRVIKLALFDPAYNYPWNSQWDVPFNSIVDIARHRYFDQVFRMDFDTYVLVAYSVQPLDEAHEPADWWRGSYSVERAARESQQFYEVALYLSQTFGNKTFILANGHGDWAMRGGVDWEMKKLPTRAAISNMIGWLGARQAGVERARKEAATKGYTGVVWHAVELDLVKNTWLSQEENVAKFGTVVNRVLPHVRLDMISYAATDTQQEPELFRKALQHIKAQHNRSNGSPNPAIFVGEYGLAQNDASAAAVEKTMEDVLFLSNEFKLPYVLFNSLYDHKLHSKSQAGRCSDETVSNASLLKGHWLVRPDGSEAWPYGFLHSLVAAPSNDEVALRWAEIVPGGSSAWFGIGLAVAAIAMCVGCTIICRVVYMANSGQFETRKGILQGLDEEEDDDDDGGGVPMQPLGVDAAEHVSLAAQN